ncbi:putative lipoate-protein ligase [Podospora fimiseda]|uniref:lipoyl(octanoyl) transferase n=1 Tax=Podospora fimiseda TaxID=252190 RepID=A0AAN7BQB0_9PEZI|nr:putative lipoate-protein ligase [Podospora fimiseda]
MAPLRLKHIHLSTPNSLLSSYIPYSLASRLQDQLRRELLDFKDSSSDDRPPPPTLISFSPKPIYTLGRRQTTPLTEEESQRLQAPLLFKDPRTGVVNLPVSTEYSLRGGLVTYHGPGQVVLWPVIDLSSKGLYKQFTVRCYSRLLEDTTISTLDKLFGIKAEVTDDPGVWVENAKIAALGVHLRRHVSGLGTAINVDMDGSDKGDEGTNPWKRVVACGLEGKKVTSVREVLGGDVKQLDKMLGLKRMQASRSAREEKVADAWAKEFAERIGVEGVEKLGPIEVAKEVGFTEGSS